MLFDSHLHLNGSLSEEFLKQMASEKGKSDIFYKIKVNALLIKKFKNDLEAGIDVNAEIIKLIFNQFALIYEIITFNDYPECINDIVKHTPATHLEVRTTPKLTDDGEINRVSVTCFLTGLKKHSQDKSKMIKGILSIDRTKYTLTLGRAVVDIVTEHEELVGIDISGNPEAPRMLSGESLRELINYALDKQIGVTIHLGESQSKVEHDDINMILMALEQRRLVVKSVHKVRFGHCIYLTKEQKVRIRNLGIPIEVAPTCHQMLGWWKKGQMHPAADIYPEDPIMYLSGTDDITLFGSRIDNEAQRVAEITGSSEFQDEQIARFGFF